MKKILLIRFSSIGDIVLTSPVLRCIKHQHPGIELHCLTKKSFAFLYQQNQYVDKVHVYDGNMNSTIRELKQENFDYIIDLHNNIRTLIVKSRLRKPSTSFFKVNIEKWLMVNFRINKLPSVHIVDRYFGAVKSLGVTNDGKGLDYEIPTDDYYPLHLLPETHKKGYVALVIGAKFATKRMPVSKIISICRKINKPILVLGGNDDKKASDQIMEAKIPLVYSLCGDINLNQSASLLKYAEVVLTNDTGLMHIAAALDKKIISFWGNTIPEFGMYPYYPHTSKHSSVLVENKSLHCRPCSKIGFASCPKKHFKCMMDLDETVIVDSVLNKP